MRSPNDVVNIPEAKRLIVSSWIRERTTSYEPLELDAELVKKALRAKAPSFQEKSERMMLIFDGLSPCPGHPVLLGQVGMIDTDTTTGKSESSETAFDIFGRCWLGGIKEYAYIVERYLVKEVGYLERLGELMREGIARDGYTITPNGWKYLKDLQHNKDSHNGFVALCFEPQYDALHERIREAIRKAGWKPDSVKSVDRPHNNYITDEIIAGIKRARFVVADFTEHRQSVYYEAGMARGMGLPVVYMVREDHLEKDSEMRLAFDTRQISHIVWTQEEVEKGTLAKRLSEHVAATIGFGPDYDPNAR